MTPKKTVVRKSNAAAAIITAHLNLNDNSKDDMAEETTELGLESSLKYDELEEMASSAMRAMETLNLSFAEASAQYDLIKSWTMVPEGSSAIRADEIVSTAIHEGTRTTAEKCIMTDPDKDWIEQVAELEEALMICYFDYQSEKAKNEVLTQSLEEANEKVKILTGRNEDLRNKLKAKSKLPTSNAVRKAPFIPSYVSSDFVLGALMRKLPKFPNRPHPSERRPVCRSDVNLKTYIESDIQTRKYTNKFLYLPERTVWCNQDEDQALAFGPLFFCDKNNRSVRGSTFAELYGKMFHLFILKDKLVYYAGFYKALDIRSIIPDGVRIGDFNGGVSPHGLAEATLSEAGDITLRTYRLHAISRLYQDGVLKAECMALHNIGFDYNLYERLSLRYAADALLEKGKPVVTLRDPYYPHAELLAEDGNSIQGNQAKRLRLG